MIKIPTKTTAYNPSPAHLTSRVQHLPYNPISNPLLVYWSLGSTPRTKRDTKHITVTSKSFVWESNLVFAHRMRMPPWQYDRWEKEKKKIRQRSPEERMPI
ncbi:uncharacterized protein LACBIDRAFT_334888 [Laccaria bicolor S238N-H82]|uniref:Predicted protein n=1 Tax=Laccaria bicolor (strain S238N-H82 / ATCC MYA-4686) TaxID=486041 RepID=B0E0N8_LACBS|nr:uncharacterized protein LACBIDRAFT_334888 [Laccaria bicolor S238N-H82]EDQ99649.1 predicted protein [Laccaria bicolor S238N-H82]|eukprot:XP_001889760.1 predicted protein [Laccaria bicolor S238N-H82]